MCPLGRLVGPAGLPCVGSLWALLRPRCEVDVDESLVEGAAGGGAGRHTPPPTLLACFIIRASFETVKVLVTHGRTQKTHGENIITETLTAVPNTLTQQRRCYHATGHLQQTDNRPIWRHRHTWTSPQNMRTPLPCNTGSTTVTQPWYHDHLKWTTWNTYV